MTDFQHLLCCTRLDEVQNVIFFDARVSLLEIGGDIVWPLRSASGAFEQSCTGRTPHEENHSPNLQAAGKGQTCTAEIATYLPVSHRSTDQD